MIIRILLAAALFVFICYRIYKKEKRELAAIAEREWLERENLRRLEAYFRRSDKLWRLYQCARKRGITFSIQSADEALADFRAGIVNWVSHYCIKEKKAWKGPRTYEITSPEIVVPLDVLEMNADHNVQKFHFLAENLQELKTLNDDSFDLLESLAVFLEKFTRTIRELEKLALRDDLFTLSHEIGHLELAKENPLIDYSGCPLFESDDDFSGCLFKELLASLKGWEILGELGLRELAERDDFLRRAKAIAFRQCHYCRPAKERGDCRRTADLDEILKEFPAV